jgi:hypothetical protein
MQVGQMLGRGAWGVPLPCAQQVLHFRELSRQGEHLPHGVFGHAARIDGRHVGNCHALVAGLVHGDHVQACAVAHDAAQRGGRCEQVARQGRSHHDVLRVPSHRAQGVGVGGGRMAQLELA